MEQPFSEKKTFNSLFNEFKFVNHSLISLFAFKDYKYKDIVNAFLLFDKLTRVQTNEELIV